MWNNNNQGQTATGISQIIFSQNDIHAHVTTL